MLGDVQKMFIGSAAAAAKPLQSCPTLCDPIDDSPPGSPVPGILQARTLEWLLGLVVGYLFSERAVPALAAIAGATEIGVCVCVSRSGLSNSLPLHGL